MVVRREGWSWYPLFFPLGTSSWESVNDTGTIKAVKVVVKDMHTKRLKVCGRGAKDPRRGLESLTALYRVGGD